MKKLLLTLLLGCSFALNAQVGIGTTTPAATLDVSSSDDGILIPRVALTMTTSALPLTTPTESELVYNTATAGDVTPGYYYWDSLKWVKLASANTNAWTITGNAGTTPGDWAVPGTNFLGTTDAQDLFVRTNNSNRIRIKGGGTIYDGNIEFGNQETHYAIADGKFYFQNDNDNNYVGIFNNLNNSTSNVATSSIRTENRTGGGTGNKVGIEAIVSSAGAGSRYGVSTTVSDNTGASGNVIGSSNFLTVNSPAVGVGISHMGQLNSLTFSTTGNGVSYGVWNSISTPSGGVHDQLITGVRNDLSIRTNSTVYGSNTVFGGTTTTTGTKYGHFVRIPSTFGGTHYGFYADVTKTTNAYAGYFAGRVSIGSGTAVGTQYIMPLTRGTNGQVITTDGSGNASWGNASSLVTSYFYHNTASVYNVTLNDYVIRVDNTATGVLLPNAAGNTGKVYILIGMNGITAKPITTGGGVVFDDVTNANVTDVNPNSRIQIQSNGTDWIVIGN